MYEYDKTFDRKVFLGHCDLISLFSDFALYRHSVGIFSYFFLIMNEYDQTLSPNILIIGHYDLISWFSDFALYLNLEWVYDQISFTL